MLIGVSATSIVRDEEVGLAKLKAKSLAAQLANEPVSVLGQLSHHQSTTESTEPVKNGQLASTVQSGSADRAPASVVPETPLGEIGTDPWGRPYKFAVLGEVIAVWSAGRDGVVASEVAELDFRLLGDDIGAIVRRRERQP